MTYRDISMAFSVMPQEKIIKPNCKYNIWMQMNKYVKSIVIWEDGYDPFDQTNQINPIHFNGIYLLKSIAAVLINGCITYYSIDDQVTNEIDDVILEEFEMYVQHAKNAYISGDNMILKGYHIAMMLNEINKYQCENNYIINSIKLINKATTRKYVYRYRFKTPNPSLRLEFEGINVFDYSKMLPDATIVRCYEYDNSKWVPKYKCMIMSNSSIVGITVCRSDMPIDETGIVPLYDRYICSVIHFLDIIKNEILRESTIYIELLFARIHIIKYIYNCEYNDIFETGYFGEKNIGILPNSKYWKQKSF